MLYDNGHAPKSYTNKSCDITYDIGWLKLFGSYSPKSLEDMGIKGLTRFIADHQEPEHSTLADLPISANRSFIVVDGYSIYRKFGLGLEWLRGGEYGPVWHRVKEFMAVFQKVCVRVIVVYDGNPHLEVKLEEWGHRRLQDRRGWLQAVAALEQGELPDNFSKNGWQPA